MTGQDVRETQKEADEKKTKKKKRVNPRGKKKEKTAGTKVGHQGALSFDCLRGAAGRWALPWARRAAEDSGCSSNALPLRASAADSALWWKECEAKRGLAAERPLGVSGFAHSLARENAPAKSWPEVLFAYRRSMQQDLDSRRSDRGLGRELGHERTRRDGIGDWMVQNAKAAGTGPKTGPGVCSSPWLHKLASKLSADSPGGWVRCGKAAPSTGCSWNARGGLCKRGKDTLCQEFPDRKQRENGLRSNRPG